VNVLAPEPIDRNTAHDGTCLQTPLTAGATAGASRRTIGWFAAGLAGPAAAVGLLIAPADRLQGDAQRLMYLHVPAAWSGFLALGAVLVCSIGYLATRDLRWDRCAQVAAEIGVGLIGLAILIGSIWGRAVWGTWWTWDPRLVSTAVLLLVYAGYLAAREVLADGRPPSARNDHRTARWAARNGIGGFGLVPVVHFSVVWWRSLHQPATIIGPGRPPIDAVMAIALALSVLAFTAGGFWLFLRRLAALEAAAGVPVSATGPDRPIHAGPATTSPEEPCHDPAAVR
jgi:heme exporter protein C